MINSACAAAAAPLIFWPYAPTYRTLVGSRAAEYLLVRPIA